MKLTFKGPLNGELKVPGDKSITHRALMVGSISTGKTVIHHPLTGDDCMSTMNIFRKLGVNIEEMPEEEKIIIEGKGIEGLNEPYQVLDTGNSGTTTRLLAGLLAGLPFMTILSGDTSIASRPMDRVIKPLKKMNAHITGAANDTRTPIVIQPAALSGIKYEMEVSSAQVKSAILLAGLFSDGEVTVIEKEKSRNHTELMFKDFGVDIKVEDKIITMPPEQSKHLCGCDVYVPGDISSAAFFIAGSIIIQDSSITIKHVGLNETRAGIIEVIQMMGGNITVTDTSSGNEPAGDISVSYTEKLMPVTIEGELIPRLIDEIPVIALMLTQAAGVSIIKDAEELKVKETNRIDAVVDTLNALGFKLEKTDDGMKIYGGVYNEPETMPCLSSFGDHRIGMMIAIAQILTGRSVEVEQFEAVSISYPQFLDDLTKITGGQ